MDALIAPPTGPRRRPVGWRPAGTPHAPDRWMPYPPIRFPMACMRSHDSTPSDGAFCVYEEKG